MAQDFETDLYKKTAGKVLRLLLGNIASRIKMANGQTLETALSSLGANVEQTKTDLSLHIADNNAHGLSVVKNNFTETIQEINAKIAALEAQIRNSGVYNQSQIITESGTFIAPVSSYYEITIINGGNGATINTYGNAIDPGSSGARETFLQYLLKDQEVDVLVGAGGLGNTAIIDGDMSFKGGITSFGNLTPDINKNFAAKMFAAFTNAPVTNLQISGAGEGGGTANDWSHDGNNGRWYGGGGSGVKAGDMKYCGDGAPGAVILRWNDPSKMIPEQEG